MRGRVTRSRSVGAFVPVLALLLVSCSSGSTPGSTVAGLTSKKVSAGSIEVTMTPRQLDSRGARFDIALDTHSGDLGLDVARSSTLEVAGRPWQPARWSGDGPGGHHCSGTLEFPRGGPTSGTIRLVIGGLPAPVAAVWQR